ncbi:hypothetical protein HPB51_027893 [Rhipicephalus microplus]|uniref:Uncharacterized protein n=1 Tax=Rhipicephalus microplus TaxID=6941 RepID=A0A9J6CYV1_RHIMP|nr:hypothetical protein HPB51_027893 [Rhipicephalus microplus]
MSHVAQVIAPTLLRLNLRDVATMTDTPEDDVPGTPPAKLARNTMPAIQAAIKPCRPVPEPLRLDYGRCFFQVQVHRQAFLQSSFCASPTRFKTYQSLFRDALLKSSSIEILKLNLTRFDVCENVCNIVAAAAHCVKELELHSDGLGTAGVVSALSTVLKTTNTLVILKIPDVIMTRMDADDFFRSLAENKTLRELSVNESAFTEASVASRTLFANLLEREDTLRALAISKGSEVWYRYSFMPTALPTRWILQSLLANRTVTSLNLAYVVIDGESARLLSALFKESKVLRKFCFASSTTDLRVQPRLTYDCWIETLAENDSLQELTLPFGIWEVGSWKRFFDNMSMKRNLTSVNISVDMLDYPCLPEICECVRVSGIYDRVSVSTYYSSESFDLLESKVFSNISFVSFGDFTSVVRLLRQMPLYPHITSVRLDIWTGDITLSLVFADYMKSSSTLKNLRLWLGSDGSLEDANGWRTAILASLFHCKSIREPDVTSMRLEQQDVYLLADLVTLSRSIETAHFGIFTLAESGALVRRLSLCIDMNYTLRRVSLESPVDREAVKHFFIVWDVARRNSDLLALAAQFVTGTRRER